MPFVSTSRMNGVPISLHCFTVESLCNRHIGSRQRPMIVGTKCDDNMIGSKHFPVWKVVLVIL